MKPFLILALAALSAAAPAAPKNSGSARLQPGGFKFYVERRGASVDGAACGVSTTAAAVRTSTWYRNSTSLTQTTPASLYSTVHHTSLGSEVVYTPHHPSFQTHSFSSAANPLAPRKHDPSPSPTAQRDSVPGPEPFPSYPMVHWKPGMNGAPPLTDTSSEDAEDWKSSHMSDYSSNPSESEQQSNPAYWDQPPAWP
ncbi:hypothetical protein EJ07DRAFT_151796 [Lizonia empirigonia]|nr:hypothetical protein EJ07DRAFT_151796 [Lizonia empirigonia]